jgi:hypothetical protein
MRLIDTDQKDALRPTYSLRIRDGKRYIAACRTESKEGGRWAQRVA